MKKLALLLLLTVCFTFSYSQSFEGSVVFKITYENLPPEMKGHEGMMPTEFSFQIKNEKSRMEMSTMMGPAITITDNKAKTSTVLMNMMGQKMKMTVDFDEAKEMADEANKQMDIQYVDGTKVIAGYTCKKAIMKISADDESGVENEGEITFYYTQEIAPIEGMKGFEGVGLKGMPLEYTINQQGITMMVTATSVEKKSIDESVFLIPDGYTEMPANMKQAMQQQR